MKTIGLVAHSAEGAALCFRTACASGQERLGPHMHPPIVLSAIPMGLSMSGWQNGDHEAVAGHLTEGVQMVADAGADFYVCPDNTAHIVLEKIAATLPVPGLHIADVVCQNAVDRNWSCIGLLGTSWTMSGPVYSSRLAPRGMQLVTPSRPTQRAIHGAIFDRLCQGIFDETTTTLFLRAVDEVRCLGAQAVILGCTEIPCVVTEHNSPLPTLDSTRLLARGAVRLALQNPGPSPVDGWLPAS